MRKPSSPDTSVHLCHALVQFGSWFVQFFQQWAFQMLHFLKLQSASPELTLDFMRFFLLMHPGVSLLELHVKCPVEGHHLLLLLYLFYCIFALAHDRVPVDSDFLLNGFALLFDQKAVIWLLSLKPWHDCGELSAIFFFDLFDFFEFLLLLELVNSESLLELR